MIRNYYTGSIHQIEMKIGSVFFATISILIIVLCIVLCPFLLSFVRFHQCRVSQIGEECSKDPTNLNEYEFPDELIVFGYKYPYSSIVLAFIRFNSYTLLNLFFQAFAWFFERQCYVWVRYILQLYMDMMEEIRIRRRNKNKSFVFELKIGGFYCTDWCMRLEGAEEMR